MASKSSPTSKAVHEERNDLMKEMLHRDGWVELHFVGNTKQVGPVGLPDGNLVATLGRYSLYSGDGEPRPANERQKSLVAAFSRSQAASICGLLKAHILCILLGKSVNKRPSNGFLVNYREWMSACAELQSSHSSCVRTLHLSIDGTNSFNCQAGVIKFNQEHKLHCVHVLYQPWASDIWSITGAQIHDLEIQHASKNKGENGWIEATSKTYPIIDETRVRLLLISFLAPFWQNCGPSIKSDWRSDMIKRVLKVTKYSEKQVSEDLAATGFRALSPSLAKKLFRVIVAEMQSLLKSGYKRSRRVDKRQNFQMLLAIVEPLLFTEQMLPNIIRQDCPT